MSSLSPVVQVTIMLSPLFALLAVVFWVVTVDAKRRWPHLSWFGRWTAVVTFDAHRQDAVARRARGGG